MSLITDKSSIFQPQADLSSPEMPTTARQAGQGHIATGTVFDEPPTEIREALCFP